MAAKRFRFALTVFAIWLWLAPHSSAQESVTSLSVRLDNSLIRAVGTTPIYIVRNGKKYHVLSLNWIRKNGYNENAVRELPPSEVDMIPPGYDLTDDAGVPGTGGALDGQLIAAGPKMYIITGGQRHWILNWEWITHSRYNGHPVITLSPEDIEPIPLGINYLYTPPNTRIRSICSLLILFAGLTGFYFLSTRDYVRNAWTTKFSGLANNKFFANWKPWHTRLILFLVFALAIAAREPYLLLHPRFWAEEGTDWFQYAIQHSIIQNLDYVCPASGYLNFTANVGAVLSSLTAASLGLEYAPAATTLLAYMIMLIPIALILFGRSVLFDSLWKAVAGCLIVIFACTTPDEIWMNTINSMSFLGLISFLLLFEKTWTWPDWLRWGSRGILIVCGLSSPYTAALLPFYILYAIRGRTREQKIQCLILMACVLVQVGTAVNFRLRTDPAIVASMRRGTDVHLDVSVVNVFFGQVVPAAVGPAGQNFLLDKLGLMSAWTTASASPPRPLSSSLQAGAWVCFFVMALALWHLRGPTLYSPSNMLIAVFVTLAAFTCITSLGSRPLGRYAFLPGITFLLIVLLGVESARMPLVRYASMAVLAFGLASGIVDYRSQPFQTGPLWSNEVRIWRADHSHVLRVWPAGWTGLHGGIIDVPASER